MKGQKGEGAKQIQAKGALAAAERGPLFPRLHVNETEKAGPKAPPRNKMALYEQFTVPSHRFVQPSQKPATTMYQQQYGIHELGYPCVPYYIPSGPNHGVPMFSQPSHNTGSSGVISSGAVNEESRHNAPRQQKSGKPSPCRVSRHLTDTIADCSVRSLPAQKDKVAIAQAQSSPTNRAEEFTNSLQYARSDTEGPLITDITESLQEALSTVEVGMDSMGPDFGGCESSKGQVVVDSVRGTCLTDEDKLKQAAQVSIFEMLTQPTKEGPSGPLDKSTVQCCLQTESSRDECKADRATEALTSHAQCGTFIEPKGLEERSTVNAQCHVSFSSEKQSIISPQSAFTSVESLENILHKNASKNFTTDAGKVDYMAGEFPKLSTANSEELKHIQKRNIEESQNSRYGTHKEGHSDGSVLPSTCLDTEWIIKPKDVIRAVGQQQFWKARKKLLRQQRIFSDQVFQLHKLIKIQQLLAETPGTLLEEERHFEAREDIDATNTSAKRAITSSEDANKAACNMNGGSKCTSSERAEGQRSEKGGQTQADGIVDLGSNACRPPESSSVGVSAWGYPSLGPWVGSMAASQGGPFNYPPFGGAFASGSAFGLPMGPLFPGSMMSFGIPYYGGRQEPLADVDSNYGPPPTTFNREGGGTVSVNSNDLAASWYFAQYNHMHNHRFLAGGSKKDAPTGSGASVNNSSATAQAVKAPGFSGLSYQWGLNCQQAGPFNTDGLENSAQQKEAVCLSVDGSSSDGCDNPSDVNPSALELFPLVPSLSSSGGKVLKAGEAGQAGIIRAVPRHATAASKSTAGILLSLQRERQK